MSKRMILPICLLALSVAACQSTGPAGPGEGDSYRVRLTTTAGDFIIEVHPDWAPVGAERFRALVESGYYDGCRFFRVAPGFVVQFGINGDPAVSAAWSESTIPDDPVEARNTRGRVAFAMTSEPESRTTQIFISFGDNSGLDARGFAPFGEVVEGMDVVDRINPQYGEAPDQGKIHTEGNAYLDREYPRLDRVEKAVIEN